MKCEKTSMPEQQAIKIYTGSTFTGRLIISDVHGGRYMISEDDELTLFFKPTDKTMTKSFFAVALTSDDEIMGEYPFKLSAQQTAAMIGDYYCYAFVRFADGDYCQILSDVPVKALVPHEGPLYSENMNCFMVQVPRVMGSQNYLPGIFTMEQAIIEMNDQDNDKMLLMRRLAYFDIVLVSDCIDTNTVTPAHLVERIRTVMDTSEADNCFVSGFFHADELPEQAAYLSAVKAAFTDSFIDVQALLKTPVKNRSGEVIGSQAFDALRKIPKSADILKILHNEYPDCITTDETHFNENGCYAAAKVILWEAHDRLTADNEDNSEP